MMSRLYIFLLFVRLLAASAEATAQQNSSWNRIILPRDAGNYVRAAAEDMAYWLGKSTGKHISIEQGVKNDAVGDIRLQWPDEAVLDANIKKELSKDGQSFYLIATKGTAATIIGTGQGSFINGIYTLLQELGFRWYMPGDNWTIIPQAPFKEINIRKLYRPDFRNRLYVGTGGVNAVQPIDPQNTFRKDFEQWNVRNRYSLDYESKGHTGNAFYSANKKELDMHPDYFCNGKVNNYGRIDISNPAAVNLYVQWALKQLKPGDDYPSIGVDPADGSGEKDDCLPAGMTGIKTWSDKYFWLANKVAEALPASSPSAVVQLYAYASHADVPGIALHKKVYPLLIPYAFQRVATPEGFIDKWSKKIEGRPMGIYDYWNIAQWSGGLPQFNIFSIPEKLRYWKKHNITTVHIESTYGKGAMGHSFWLASQMMWNTALSFDSLYLNFLQTCFGAAAPDIKRMYDRWSTNYQGHMEVALSLNDLKLASGKTSDKTVLARITELKAYVHYIKLYYAYTQQPAQAAYDELINYLHLIHPLRLIQTWAMEANYIAKPKGPGGQASRGVKSGRAPLPQDQLNTLIEKEFRNDLAESHPLYTVSDFRFDITRLRTVSPTSAKAVSAPISGRNEYIFYLDKEKSFQLKARCTGETLLTIIGNDKKVVYERRIAVSKDDVLLNIKLPAGKYSIFYGDLGRFAWLEFPRDIVFVMPPGISYYDNAGYPLLYLYIPRDVDAIVYEDRLGPGVNRRGYWIDPDGNKVMPQKLNGNVYQVKVPANQKGRVWTLNIGHRSFAVLNIPNYFSITPFSLREN